MVRKYKRKGGHGGSRLGAGLQPGHWEHQGGRKAAAQTKRDIEQRGAAKEASEKAKRTAMWLKVAAKSAAVQSGSGNHTSTDGQAAVKQGHSPHDVAHAGARAALNLPPACCVWLLCVVAPSLLQFSMYWRSCNEGK